MQSKIRTRTRTRGCKGAKAAVTFESFSPLVMLKGWDTDTHVMSGATDNVAQITDTSGNGNHGIPSSIGAGCQSGTRTLDGSNIIDCTTGINITDVLDPSVDDFTFIYVGIVDDYNWRSFFSFGVNSEYEVRSNPSAGIFTLGSTSGIPALYTGRTEPDTTPILVGARKRSDLLETFIDGKLLYGSSATPGITTTVTDMIIQQSMNGGFGGFYGSDRFETDADLNALINLFKTEAYSSLSLTNF